jgi:hypothetical protein
VLTIIHPPAIKLHVEPSSVEFNARPSRPGVFLSFRIETATLVSQRRRRVRQRRRRVFPRKTTRQSRVFPLVFAPKTVLPARFFNSGDVAVDHPVLNSEGGARWPPGGIPPASGLRRHSSNAKTGGARPRSPRKRHPTRICIPEFGLSLPLPAPFGLDGLFPSFLARRRPGPEDVFPFAERSKIRISRE